MTTQINLKITEELMKDVEEYSKENGYLNIQELVRTALREKIYDNYEIRQEYRKILESDEAKNFKNVKESKKIIDKLREKAGL
jgi:metal-responsive CopG/Arc/MetJ family transcriptional regulator